MLNQIRQHADSWMVKTILWLIILAFLGTIFYSWGMGGASTSRGGVVATVEGDEIHFGEYDRAFNNLVNFYRDQFKSQFSEDLMRRLDIKSQALDTVIQKRLLLMEAQRLNIQVSDPELIHQIKSFPAFQKDGKFDNNLYANFVKFQRLTPSEFEESQRESLLLQKVENLVHAGALVSDSEITEAFKLEDEKVKLAYLTFRKDAFKSDKLITDDALRAFFENNKKDFEVSRQIKVEYVKVEPKSFEDSIDPREEDIQDYYEAKIADFRIEKRYEASHILFQLKPVDLGADAADEEKEKASEEAAKAKADEAMKKFREGADFGELAKELSDDKSSAVNNGSLGQFPRGTMVRPFEVALEKLQVGEISDPVLSAFGYHIIRLDKETEERIQPLSEVKDPIVQTLKSTKARQRARRILKRIFNHAEKTDDLTGAAQKHDVQTRVSEYFSRDTHDVKDIGVVPEFYNMAFTLPKGKVSSPINTPEASYMMKLIEIKQSYIPEFAKVQEDIKKEAAEKADKEMTKQKFKDLANRLGQGTPLETLAEEMDLDIRRTPMFSRSDSIPGIGNVRSIKEKVFPLEKGKTATDTFRNNYYLLRVEDKEEPGAPDEKKIKSLRAQLKQQKEIMVFQDWLKELREKANIMIDRTLL